MSTSLASLGVAMDKPKVTREGLIAAGLCVACLTEKTKHGAVHCQACIRRFYQADASATKGMILELDRERKRGML